MLSCGMILMIFVNIMFITMVQVAGEFFPSGSASNADPKYKILHMDCDKKVVVMAALPILLFLAKQ